MNISKVITWGRVASHVARQQLKVDPVEFPHPSGAANGTWSKLLGARATRENKVNYWRQEITAALAA